MGFPRDVPRAWCWPGVRVDWLFVLVLILSMLQGEHSDEEGEIETTMGEGVR